MTLRKLYRDRTGCSLLPKDTGFGETGRRFSGGFPDCYDEPGGGQGERFPDNPGLQPVPLTFRESSGRAAKELGVPPDGGPPQTLITKRRCSEASTFARPQGS